MLAKKVSKSYQSGALIVVSTSCFSMAWVRRLTAAPEAPSTVDKNSSLYASIVMGGPNLYHAEDEIQMSREHRGVSLHEDLNALRTKKLKKLKEK